MRRALLALLALLLVAPIAFAQQLPPPQNPAGDEPDLLLRRADEPQGPAIVPPQNVQPQQQPPPVPLQGGQVAKKTPEQLHQLILARHKAEKERLQARMDRMNQAKAARAAEEQKLYHDWHERYLADTPVRVEYYRALAAYYQSQPAISSYTPYYYGASPSVILPVVYAPVVVAPIYQPYAYGIFTSWGW